MESEETAADNTVTGTVMLGAGVPVSGVDNSLSQPAYMLPHNQVMTDQQMETLRRQISVYSTICSQLVEMHKAMSQQGSVSRQHMLYDTVAAAPGIKPSARQRWTPSQAQLHILETLYEGGNGTPSRQRIKEITSELSKHGQISETSVYNWFQNRKARAKRKQQQLPLKEGESEGDTDGESSKEKKSKLDGEFHQEDTGAGQGEQNAQASEKTHGAITHKPRAIDEQQFDDTQETALSSLLLPEAEAEPHVLIDRTGTAAVASTEYGVTQTKFAASTQLGSGTMTVMLDGKQWQVPIGVVDVRRMFGDNAVLLDSRGHMVPTNDAGVTFHPLHASESYTLLRHGEIRGSTSAKSSEGLLVHNLHHISGILNEGLVGGPMLH